MMRSAASVMFRSAPLKRGGSAAICLLRAQSTMACTAEAEAVVKVHQYRSTPDTSSSTAASSRLPNDMRERNAMYTDEAKRSMSGIDARVRHVSNISEMGLSHFYYYNSNIKVLTSLYSLNFNSNLASGLDQGRNRPNLSFALP